MHMETARTIRAHATPVAQPVTKSARKRAVAGTAEAPAILRIADFAPPRGVSPGQWEQAVGLARVLCARVFRDGGTPSAAVESAGVDASPTDWDAAIRTLATHMCR
jgi:hypothetical protein